jgi:S1-C subfamily serine protease
MYSRSLRHIFPLSILLATILTAMGGVASHTRAAPNIYTAASGSPGVQLAAPAVVRIISDISGQVVCKQCGSSGGDIVFPLGGGSYGISLSGSGSFISPDGYVLTADHVVDIDHNSEIDQSFLQDAMDEYAKILGLTAAQAKSDFDQLASYIFVNHQVVRQAAYLSSEYTGTLQNSAQVTSYAVTRIIANSTPDKQDTAIVKVEAHDMPYLTLAPESTIHVQDSVTSIGFPGDADTGDFSALLNPTQSEVNTVNSLLSPSVNTGQITAEKHWSDGTLAYETTGIGSFGSSGGPIIDDQGRIIGFVDAGTSTMRVIFAVPSDVIVSYMKQAGISSEHGQFMDLWTKAINEYTATGACHWTNAARDLKTIRDQYPQFAAIQPLVVKAEQKATPGECPPPSNNAGLLIGGTVGLLILIAVGAVIFFVMRRRPATAMAVPGYPTQTYIQSPYATGSLPFPPAPTPSQPSMQPISDVPQSAVIIPLQPPMASIPTPPPPPPPMEAPTFIPPATPSQPQQVQYVCANGHVQEKAARFCSECGTPVQEQRL